MGKIQKNTEISAYTSVKDRGNSTTTDGEELERIATGEYKNPINTIRCSSSKEIRQAIKLQLPLVSWGGTFDQRINLVSPSGLACLDFDDVSNPESLKGLLRTSRYVFACWVSPSGNGVKAIIRIPLVVKKKAYQEYYLALLEHYKKLEPDQSTKDINRLCFTSYDPNLYVNDNAEVFTRKVSIQAPVVSEVVPNDLPEALTIQRLFRWWKGKFNYGPGNRNQSLFVLCASLSEYGVSKETAKGFLANFQESDFRMTEINMLVDSAYKRTSFNIKSFG